MQTQPARRWRPPSSAQLANSAASRSAEAPARRRGRFASAALSSVCRMASAADRLDAGAMTASALPGFLVRDFVPLPGPTDELEARAGRDDTYPIHVVEDSRRHAELLIAAIGGASAALVPAD